MAVWKLTAKVAVVQRLIADPIAMFILSQSLPAHP